MKRPNLCAALILLFLQIWNAKGQSIDIMFTTDVHGSFLNYDFIKGEKCGNGLEAVYTTINSIRDTASSTLLLDGGDIMQGTPLVYYSNYVDTATTNISAQVYNYMGYDAVCIGNHDIEATHKVYDKAVREFEMPVLGANVVNVRTGKPYFEPYSIFKRGGKRIAVIGLTTPYVPHWLAETYWSGMQFEDMVESARKWVDYVRKNEKPDAVIGVFHAGTNYNYGGQNADTPMNENASLLVAERVEGFDLILTGHDHREHNLRATTPSGKKVQVLGPGKSAYNLGHIRMTFGKGGEVTTEGRLISMEGVAPSEKMHKRFAKVEAEVRGYTGCVICKLGSDINAYETLMGSSAFVDLVNKTMLKHTGADISMSAPLTVKAHIPAGDLTVGRMFSLYPFENTLCVLRLTGKEILDYLEYSYDLWIENPQTTGHVLRLARKGRLLNDFFALDAALGIDYTVDVTKPRGQRVAIRRLSDGRPFDKKKSYTVAMNSYRANGGSGHLEFGAGIPFDKIMERVVRTIDQDIRGLMVEDLAEMGRGGKVVKLTPEGNWRFVPAKEVKKSLAEDVAGFVVR